ncbi:MAG: Rieske (2Fe-2S) protein, partial [Anaerolineae bacterium]|nr:Rieske (2Fe-2S) protein [Anaerolineae bacterium]
MRWVQVLAADQLSPGDREVVEVEEREIVLANERGTLYAFDSRCPHMGASLEDAAIDAQGVLTCPRHRSRFRLDTGEVVDWAPWPPVVGAVLG